MTPPSSFATQQCTHFGRCGGCSQLDQPIDVQLRSKQQRAREVLAPHLAGLEPQISLPPRTPRHDRTAILYPVQQRGRRPRFGIYRRGTHDVEEIRDCRIQHKALTEFGVRLAEALPKVGVSVYDETTGRGVLRAIRARIMPGTNELLVGVVSATPTFAGRDELTSAMLTAAMHLRDDQGRPVELVGVVQNINSRPGNALLGDKTRALVGDAWQTDRVRDLTFQVSFASFYQQHRHAEAILFAPAIDMLGDVTGQQVVDGYGGVGAFALRLLRAGAGHVTLIESSPSACADARVNLRHNKLTESATVRHEAFGQHPLPPCDVLVVDPPRAGLMADGTAAVLAAQPERVLLVSCSLESLTRDLQQLGDAYCVQAMRLCDLFPHTEHVETVTLLHRNA